MKTCSVCGCSNADASERCEICGVYFPKFDLPKSPASSVVSSIPQPEPGLPPQKDSEDPKSDRIAIAGFVLSLMGVATLMTSPLQLAALILCVCGKTKKFRRLRSLGIILSSVALGISLILWLIIGVNAETVFTYLNNIMNEFYY